MDQFDWLVTGSSSTSSYPAESNDKDSWLHMESLLLEGLDEEVVDFDDLAAQRAFSSATTESEQSQNAGNSKQKQPAQQQQQQLSVSQMAIATQQAILASSLLANHSYLSSLNMQQQPQSQTLNPRAMLPQIPLPMPHMYPTLPLMNPGLSSSSGPSSSSARVGSASTSAPVKTESEIDKRRRNTEASARFRAKKKMKQEAMEQTTKQLNDKVEALERRLQEYEMEIQMLRQEVEAKEGSSKKRLRDLYEANGLQFNEGMAAAGQGIERTLLNLGSSSSSGLVFDDDSDSMRGESLTDLIGLDLPQDFRIRKDSSASAALAAAAALASVGESVSVTRGASSSSPLTSSSTSAGTKRQRRK
ncbi:UNVERIFIED_CONTAM: hypothetical protein HDU68_006791 [Siphonaria sp. JEL0065]|nr:hypothetical protein HDU68_006791 [Siphonaria sp. JEL0065]